MALDPSAIIGSFTSTIGSITSTVGRVTTGLTAPVTTVGRLATTVRGIGDGIDSLGSLFGGDTARFGLGGSGGGSAGAVSLDFGNEFQDNPLSAFEQVAYHFRLYTASNPDGSGNQIVLAETGVTGFNIRDVEIKGIVGPNFTTRSTNATEFTITITEPVGTSFLDALYLAATKNMIENYSKYIYYLELSFKGYRDGQIKTNLLENLSGGGKWTWPLQITTMDVQLDTGGGTYVIKAIAYYESVFDPKEELTTKETITVEAETVGEFFDNLGRIMTEKTVTNYGTNLYTFTFQVHAGRDGKDPAQFKLMPKDPDTSNPRIRSFRQEDGGKVAGQIIMGTPIPDIVDTVFANCEEAQGVARNGPNGGDPESLAAGETRERVVYRVYPDARITGFDRQTQKYTKSVTYHIHPFVTTKPVLVAEETAANSQQQLNAIRQRKGLVKKYEYIYTGLNTEVLQFDLRYNFAWTAQLPRLHGYRYSNDATGWFARWNETVHSNLDTYDVRLGGGTVEGTTGATGGKLADSVASASGVIGAMKGTLLQPLATPLAGIVGGVAATSAVVGNIGEQIDALKSFGSDLRQRAIGAQARVARASEIETVPSATGVTYAEDLLSGGGAVVPVAFTQTQDDARMNAGTGFASDWDRGKSIYGIILDQLYGPMATELMTVNLEIRGDPYWFGPSGMEYLQIAALMPESTFDRPDWRAGEHGFLINIRYPFKVGDDGTPQIRQQDVFSGLYMCTTVLHKFSNGEFRQTLNAYRCPLVETRDADPAATTTANASSLTAVNNDASLRNNRDDGSGGWFPGDGTSVA